MEVEFFDEIVWGCDVCFCCDHAADLVFLEAAEGYSAEESLAGEFAECSPRITFSRLTNPSHADNCDSDDSPAQSVSYSANSKLLKPWDASWSMRWT